MLIGLERGLNLELRIMNFIIEIMSYELVIFLVREMN